MIPLSSVSIPSKKLRTLSLHFKPFPYHIDEAFRFCHFHHRTEGQYPYQHFRAVFFVVIQFHFEPAVAKFFRFLFQMGKMQHEPLEGVSFIFEFQYHMICFRSSRGCLLPCCLLLSIIRYVSIIAYGSVITLTLHILIFVNSKKFHIINKHFKKNVVSYSHW